MAAPAPAGRIGPNALLQLVPVLEAAGGAALRDRIFGGAGVAVPPAASGMIEEAPVARVHQELRRQLEGRAAALAAEAGERTGDYILAHRIPAPAQRLLRVLPPALSAPLLSRAIARHAWTFAGSGGFRIVSLRPPVFEIADNPVVRGERAAAPVCHWHAAVIRQLFRALVHPAAEVRETACCAAGASACRFEVALRG